jgi:hypothetical protein
VLLAHDVDVSGVELTMQRIADHIHTLSKHVRHDGAEYEARVYGTQRSDRTWEGWIEFHPVSGAGTVLRTQQETSQPNRMTLSYWAGGLEPIYLEGALKRAMRTTAPKDGGTDHALRTGR